MRRFNPARVGAAALLFATSLWGGQFAARASPGPAHVNALALSPLASFEDDAPIYDAQAWTARRAPRLREAFLSNIYGEAPDFTTEIYARRSLIANEAARLELLTLALRLPTGQTFLHVALFTPTGVQSAPVVVAPVFCGLDSDVDAQLPSPSWRAPRCRSAVGRGLAELSHGDAILAPPLQSIIARGYAVAFFYPGEIAPDDAILFRQAPISRLINADTGAIAVWSSLYLSIVEALHTDPRIDATRIAIWGHSRFGKAALLAGALDNRVAAIIANQSGAFGATLTQATRGETSAEILRRFPHWFSQTAGTRTHSLEPLDQHLLLALLAPRPVLLGNAELDRWSDPGAAFVAARAASEVYVLFGRPGLTQPRMRDTDLNGNIAFYLRPGGHGVRSTDWFIALDFLDRHFPGPSHFASSRETDAENAGAQ